MLIDYRSGEHKEDGYYRCYDNHFGPLQDKEINLLEIGVQSGGSLIMWTKYFKNGKVTGLEIDEHAKDLDVNGATVVIGDQSDVETLKQFTGMDIIIDDGGHKMSQQRISFETLFPMLNSGGIYVIEDLHTSYWQEFLDEEQTAIDSVKALIDEVNYEARASVRSLNKPETRQVYHISEIHIYPSICFIYKK